MMSITMDDLHSIWSELDRCGIKISIFDSINHSDLDMLDRTREKLPPSSRVLEKGIRINCFYSHY